MKNLKKLGVAFALMFVLGASTFAGEVSTPCALPDPGITETPPCGAAPLSSDDLATPGQIDTPPASDAADILSVVAAAMNLLLLF